MEFNELLALEGISPEKVALALHKPGTPQQRRILCALAENDEPAFEAYQSTHPKTPEATLKARPLMASFVPSGEQELRFVGLYEKIGTSPGLKDELEADETFVRMQALFHKCSLSEAREHARAHEGRLRFDMRRSETLGSLRGRLIVRDPGARAYVRLAERTPLDVIEIGRHAHIMPPMPPWDELTLTAAELGLLPREWSIKLGAWRGIYLIVDCSDGRRYVGAAYGSENLYGRWCAHVFDEVGITRELMKRRTADFRFSILELVAPTAEAEAVIARERNWMDRLDTIRHGLNT